MKIRRVILETLCLITLGPVCESVAAHELRIDHVTIVSPERSVALRDATVSITDDRIVAIGHGAPPAARSGSAEVIDGTGLYLAPGLIDSHVHATDLPGVGDPPSNPDVVRAMRAQIPRSYLYFGYTTLIDLISRRELLAAWNAHDLHPDLYFCGGASIPEGYPPIKLVSAEDRDALYEYMLVERGQEGKAPEGVDPVTHTPEAVIKRMKADGAICVKTFYERGFGEVDELPVPRLDTIRDLVQAAHAAHLPVFIHANGTDAQEFAVNAGVDVIAHGLWHWNREQSATELTPRARGILDRVLKAKMGWQPTMQVLVGLQDLFNPGYFSDPEVARVVPASAIEWYRSAEGQWYHDLLAPEFLPKPVFDSHDPQAQWESVRAAFAPTVARNKNATHYMVTQGGRVLFGTDTPSAPTFANQPGLNGWREMQQLVEAGMTPLQIFRAATQSNAEQLGLDHEIGTVQVGKRANLLLLPDDPTRTIDAYNAIVKVILHGKAVERADLAADRLR